MKLSKTQPLSKKLRPMFDINNDFHSDITNKSNEQG